MDEPWTLDLHEPDLSGRLLAATGSAVALFGFWELVLRTWPALLAPGGWPALALGLAALAAGLMLLAAALLGSPQSLTVDQRARAIFVTARIPVYGAVRRRIPFARIALITVAENEDSESPRPLRLCLIQRGARWPVCLATRPAARRAEVEALARRLRAAVQPRAAIPSSH